MTLLTLLHHTVSGDVHSTDNTGAQRARGGEGKVGVSTGGYDGTIRRPQYEI